MESSSDSVCRLAPRIPTALSRSAVACPIFCILPREFARSTGNYFQVKFARPAARRGAPIYRYNANRKEPAPIFYVLLPGFQLRLAVLQQIIFS